MTVVTQISRRAKRDRLIAMSPDDLAGSFADARLAGAPRPGPERKAPARPRATTGQIIDRLAGALAIAAAAAVPFVPAIALTILMLSVLSVCLGIIPQAQRERAAFRTAVAHEGEEVAPPANAGWAPTGTLMAA